MTEVRHLRPVDGDRERETLDDEPSVPPHAVDVAAASASAAGVGRRRARLYVERVGRGTLALRWVIVAGLSVVAAFLLAPRLVRSDLPVDPSLVGTPARAFVKADRDYALVDADTTSRLRSAAAERSRAVWDLDVAAAQKDAQVLAKGLVRLAVALEPVRVAYAQSTLHAQQQGHAPPDATKIPPQVTNAAEPVRAILAGELALVGLEAPRDDLWRSLVKAVWLSPQVVERIQDTLRETLAQPVVNDRSALLQRAAGANATIDPQALQHTLIVIRPVPARPGGEQVREIGGIDDVMSAHVATTQTIANAIVQLEPANMSAQEAQLIGAFAAGLVRPTLTFNAAETDLQRRRDAEGVPPVIVRAHRGELVLRPGEIITERHRLLIQAMAIQQAGDMQTRARAGTGFFVALLCCVVYLFGARRVFRRTLGTKDLLFLATLLVLELIGIVAADAVSPWVQATLPGAPPQVVFLAIPVALGAMTVRLTLPPDVALLFSLVVALLGGVLIEPGMSFAIVAIVTSLTAAAGVSRSQQRTATMILAGLGAGLVGALAALALELFRGALTGVELAWLSSAVVVGGLLSGLLVIVVTPLVEVAFGYVTERRLSKLADLNHPLLKDLIVHAPGTWHHSVRTAELAEAAARAVGASALLARVMALYHDVGKMKQPQMFSENQKGDNPHDRMPAEKSADILKSHVKEGVALAEERGLPRAVIAAIEEHHVDNLMEFFYARARSSDGSVIVDEKQFRYEGRPPQTRESALVMLADHIEAAARSIEDPTRERLSDLVDLFVNRALADDLLAECDLSLRDLGRAREALTRALMKLHRQETT